MVDERLTPYINSDVSLYIYSHKRNILHSMLILPGQLTNSCELHLTRGNVRNNNNNNLML